MAYWHLGFRNNKSILWVHGGAFRSLVNFCTKFSTRGMHLHSRTIISTQHHVLHSFCVPFLTLSSMQPRRRRFSDKLKLSSEISTHNLVFSVVKNGVCSSKASVPTRSIAMNIVGSVRLR